MHRHYHLRCWTRFYASADEVWAHKTDAERLNDERMPLLRLTTAEPGLLSRALRADLGTQAVDLTLRPFGWLPGPVVPVEVEILGKWSLMERAGENALFHTWEHERRLEQASDACRYLDAITFAPKLPATRAVARLVEELFIRAHQLTAKRFSTDARATAVAMLRVVPLEDEGWGES